MGTVIKIIGLGGVGVEDLLVELIAEDFFYYRLLNIVFG